MKDFSQNSKVQKEENEATISSTIGPIGDNQIFWSPEWTVWPDIIIKSSPKVVQKVAKAVTFFNKAQNGT